MRARAEQETVCPRKGCCDRGRQVRVIHATVWRSRGECLRQHERIHVSVTPQPASRGGKQRGGIAAVPGQRAVEQQQARATGHDG